MLEGKLAVYVRKYLNDRIGILEFVHRAMSFWGFARLSSDAAQIANSFAWWDKEKVTCVIAYYVILNIIY